MLRYIAPKEGTQVGFDELAIPADAPHPDAALAFIDFVLRPEAMAAITNKVRYANAVPASDPMIDKDILDDPGIYPPPAVREKFFETGSLPPAAQRAESRMWARFRAGH
jgi:putrescine transport system substrate-binding protein